MLEKVRGIGWLSGGWDGRDRQVEKGHHDLAHLLPQDAKREEDKNGSTKSTRLRGEKEGRNTRGRENTYMHTYSGSGVLHIAWFHPFIS